uniref:Reverse transcriptase domain-containing protein n=1 Tax=Tanacetum cinerariifolium TaxID=118510 RepID=A0A6L2LAH9_TANCI|nr:hypothetical protein [Tanacetum cinerariifolium]
MKYKAEKVCHEEMVKMPLVDLKVLKDGSFRICMDYRKLSEIPIRNHCHQMRVHEEDIPKTDFRMRYGHFLFTVMPFGLITAPVVFKELMSRMNLELLKKEKCHVKPNKVEAKRKLFESFRNKMGNELILALPEGLDNFIVMREARVRMRDVRTLIMEEAHATKYSVCPGTDGQSERISLTLENMFRVCVRNLVVVGILTFREAEIGESKIIRLELEQETTKVVVIKERLKEAKDHQERVKLIVRNQTFRI